MRREMKEHVHPKAFTTETQRGLRPQPKNGNHQFWENSLRRAKKLMVSSTEITEEDEGGTMKDESTAHSSFILLCDLCASVVEWVFITLPPPAVSRGAERRTDRPRMT